ncbi:MAG: sulfurtransferase TusA family protein [Marinicella sp.]
MCEETSQYIDAKGLNCPMPLMLLKKALQDLPVGAVVDIDVTDEHAELDFETWCERFGHHLLRLGLESGVWRFQIIKA